MDNHQLPDERLSDLARMLDHWSHEKNHTLSVGERHILEDAAVACGMARRYGYLREHGLYGVYLGCCCGFTDVSDTGDDLDRAVDAAIKKARTLG